MTKEVFKDSDFAQRIEDERADDNQNNIVRFSKIIVKLFEHYKNLNTRVSSSVFQFLVSKTM